MRAARQRRVEGRAVELLKQLAVLDEYLLIDRRAGLADWPEELRRRVLAASLEMPPSQQQAVDSCIAPRSTAMHDQLPRARLPCRTCSAGLVKAPAGRSSRCGR